MIENGELQKQNLKKHRLTVDQLEMRLRTQGISKLSDVKNVTLESNGQIGYELSDDAKPFTMGEYKKFLRMQNNLQQPEDNLFKEINEGHLHEPDKQLR